MSQTTERQTSAPWDSVLALARREAATLKVADLADEAGYSPFHFARRFSAHVGIGPGQYLIAMRIDAAKRMLLGAEHPVIDVAAAVGFDSLSSFSRRFRQTVGVPPAELRRLAERISDHPPRPFSLTAPDERTVRIHLEVPEELSRRGDASIWVGWYAHPAPIGLPRSGALTTGEQFIDLPLCDSAPFLLGFAVTPDADPRAHLTPSTPVVAAHPHPITAAGEVTLRFRAQEDAGGIPLLSALPSLCRR
ncbi:helix-turn-helix transcriptional regulator [Brachybacterium sp. GCM10030252]|uniref:helix-turn-helix transcriptional regulator n=1 Tax=Brachybacterium sp. GCM10030252 TaxID=3273380 RepID=UPI00361E46DF